MRKTSWKVKYGLDVCELDVGLHSPGRASTGGGGEGDGGCQDSCRARSSHAARSVFVTSIAFVLSGLRTTAATGVQSRISPDQRSGCRVFACS